MKSLGPRTAFALLVALTAVSWVVPIWEATTVHMVSAVSALTAAMFTTLLILWPFLTGLRLSQGHVQRAGTCVECHALRWPAEAALGFCLRCGSMRPAVRAGY